MNYITPSFHINRACNDPVKYAYKVLHIMENIAPPTASGRPPIRRKHSSAGERKYIGKRCGENYRYNCSFHNKTLLLANSNFPGGWRKLINYIQYTGMWIISII